MDFNCAVLLVALLMIPDNSVLGQATWGSWTSWPVSCSTTCGHGVRCRRRQCLDGFGRPLGGTDCSGTNVDCMSCVMSSKCPRRPGWSSWGDWSECVLINSTPKSKPNAQGCLPGTKTRSRKCNNPPPDVGPNSILCGGTSRDVKKCPYGCPDVPKVDDYNLKAKLTQIVQKDHLDTRVRRLTPRENAGVVILRAPGGKVILDCYTEAYRFVKASLEAKGEWTQGSSLPTRQAGVVWRVGGRVIGETKKRFGKRKEKRLILPIAELVDEEEEWVSKLDRSEPKMRGPQLLLENLTPEDTGFYTCHVGIGGQQDQWMVTFYSLIVLGQQVSAPEQMPFYLHSNIGERSPFDETKLYWYDAARLTWILNGEKMFTDLLVRPRARIRRITSLNYSMQGQWDCHLEVALPDLPTVQAAKNVTFSARFLVNTFFLRVTERPRSLWELGDRPPSASRLRSIAIFVLISSLTLLMGVVLTVWAVRRWVQRTPRLDQLECCVEEVIDDRTRLFLVAQKRAQFNWEALWPFVRLEMKEIDELRRNPPPLITLTPEEPITIGEGNHVNPVDETKQTRRAE